MRVLVAVCAFALTMHAGSSAWAQVESREGLALQNQILQLRRDMAAQQGSRQDNDRPAPRSSDGGLTSQLLDRVTQLEEQTRQMRGELDRQGDQMRRNAEDTDKRIADMNFAVQNGGGTAGARSPRTPSPGSPPPADSVLRGEPTARDAPASAVPRTPELAMQEGNAALARRDYVTAEAAAREVLGKRGPRSGDAQYLLAQAELGSRNYQQAAPDFYDAYNRQRTGARGASALLGVANALVGLNDRASACEALAKLRAEFPQPSPDIRDGAAATRQRAGCR